MLKKLRRCLGKKNFDWLAMRQIPTKDMGLLLAAAVQLLRQPLPDAQRLQNASNLLCNRSNIQLPPPPSHENRNQYADFEELSSDSADDAEFQQEYGNNVNASGNQIPKDTSSKSNDSTFSYMSPTFNCRLPFGGHTIHPIAAKWQRKVTNRKLRYSARRGVSIFHHNQIISQPSLPPSAPRPKPRSLHLLAPASNSLPMMTKRVQIQALRTSCSMS